MKRFFYFLFSLFTHNNGDVCGVQGLTQPEKLLSFTPPKVILFLKNHREISMRGNRCEGAELKKKQLTPEALFSCTTNLI